MGKRFYCDYCEKSFPYNSQNRKKHNEGNFHQMMKSAYYAQFKDLLTIIAEEEGKRPCLKYFSSGFCTFSDKCRFSHKTPAEIQYLKDQYKLECHKKAVKEEEGQRQTNETRNIRRQDLIPKILTEQLSREDLELLEKVLPNFEISKSLKKFDLATIPPSLFPPNFKDLIDFKFNQWK